MSRASEDRLKNFKGSGQVREGLRWNRENLDKLKNYELQGSNNPKIRTKIEYGKKMHDDKESSMCGSPHYAEFEISSSVRSSVTSTCARHAGALICRLDIWMRSVGERRSSRRLSRQACVRSGI